MTEEDTSTTPLKPPPSPYSLECDSKRINYVSLYKPKLSQTSQKKKRSSFTVKWYHVVFGILYLYQIYWVGGTIGKPYKDFLEKADREGFEVMEGSTKMRAELHHALSDLNDPNRQTEQIGWFDWMNMDIEEHAERKKRSKEQSVIDSLPKGMRVPKKYAPAFVPMLVTGILVVCHALVVLLQVWSVRFNVWLNYKEVNVENVEIPEEMMEVDEESFISPGSSEETGDGKKSSSLSLGEQIVQRSLLYSPPSHLPTHARITPASGKDLLVPLLYLPTLGMTFEYHRRRYTYDPTSTMWIKIRCTTTMPTTFFTTWNGLSTPDQITALQIRFGQNVFDVKQPTFTELYKTQLLSPFTVFQLFCVILWMLDDYWQYSAFTLFMILTFEGTVVFSRIKSLNALRGMGNKSREVLVYREGKWRVLESMDLLPGDVMSLTRVRKHHASKDDDKDKKDDEKKKKEDTKKEDEDGDIVPADLLLLRGSTVVNEASLTGESVPQMKEGIPNDVLHDENEHLSMKTKHKNHVMYAGTKMLQCKGVEIVEAEEASSDEDDEEREDDIKKDESTTKEEEKMYKDIPNPPDGGCLCFVLRTGFSSGQGKLVRMIEGSQEKVKGHERDTALLLLFLFIFAVASSSYVLYHGLQDDNRSNYELLLHCIMIITSVIPPELPMQMALAVNNSLMTLMKMQVFCTEPYRVPIAGKLDACLFDKTGTLTTDELVAVGVCEAKTLTAAASTSTSATTNKKKDDENEEKYLTPMTKLFNEAALVLAGCHSLVSIEGETTGDPLESAALKAMRWCLSDKTGHAIPSPATDKKAAGKVMTVNNQSISELEVLSRHHFSSKLQRMSTVVRDVNRGNKVHYAVAKGSPEAIGKLLATKPTGYDEMAKSLSKRGFRVIAMGYKSLKSLQDVEKAQDSRAYCEEQLSFAGFIAFTCRVRKDTKAVLRRLKEGGMSVAMVTGDALLTAAHVAKEVAICETGEDEEDAEFKERLKNEKSAEMRKLLEKQRAAALEKKKNSGKKDKNVAKSILILEQDEKGQMFWQSYDDDSRIMDYVALEVPKVAESFDLATTGKNLAAAFEFDEETKKILAHFKIFARMTPDAKETVIECLHSVGSLCLMCGDGANDVGALKQADVGVALLSGFGDVNVDKGEDGNKKKDDKDSTDALAASNATAIMTKEQLDALRMLPVSLIKAKIRTVGVNPDKYPDIVEKDDLVKLYQIKAREFAVKQHEKKKGKMTRAEAQAKQRAEIAEKQRKMQLRVQELEAQGEQWAQFKAMKEFWASEMEEKKKKQATLAKNRSIEGSAATIAAQLEDLEMDELPMVKLGDASIAAPFTSKMPSIRSCVDIIRQGRCTLVTSIQMYQILALNCLISAYSLSVLYLDGVKYGDVQMTSMGMLMSVSFMSVSRSKPLDKLSKVRPLTSIFHPSLFISLLGQFVVHLVTMFWAVRSAKSYLEPDYKVDLDGEFKPGIVNSVVFLVSNVQQVTVFIVNLQGRPFMTGLTENRPLLWSLLATFILTFMFASETVPSLNKYFQLVPFPDEAFRNFILKILAADVGISFVFDRLMKLIFCPHILFASVEGTTLKDVLMLSRTIMVILFIMHTFLGNEETWVELMREEGRLLEDGENATNVTDVVPDVADAVASAAKACVGAACGEEADDVVVTGHVDEF